MLNNVVIMGRFTRDPELRTTATGTPVASFTLAVERNFGDAENRQADFIDCIAWQSTAEFVVKYFTRGRMAVLKGRLQTRMWEDQKGNKRKAVEVVAESIYFGDSKKDSAAPPAAAPKVTTTPDFSPMSEDEEVPF